MSERRPSDRPERPPVFVYGGPGTVSKGIKEVPAWYAKVCLPCLSYLLACLPLKRKRILTWKSTVPTPTTATTTTTSRQLSFPTTIREHDGSNRPSLVFCLDGRSSSPLRFDREYRYAPELTLRCRRRTRREIHVPPLQLGEYSRRWHSRRRRRWEYLPEFEAGAGSAAAPWWAAEEG